eukprot:Amastigsp_a27977_4.p3 type:complete len:150 gc:universal Amastigsp_a27977_4:547-98(-)
MPKFGEAPPGENVDGSSSRSLLSALSVGNSGTFAGISLGGVRSSVVRGALADALAAEPACEGVDGVCGAAAAEDAGVDGVAGAAAAFGVAGASAGPPASDFFFFFFWPSECGIAASAALAAAGEAVGAAACAAAGAFESAAAGLGERSM